METSEYLHRQSIPSQIFDDDNLQGNFFTYRTEAYLQHREKQNVSKSPPPSTRSTVTTWKNLKYQKRFVDNDQAEIDKVLSTMDSIHGTFNRSLAIPFTQVYSSLYGDDDKSARLIKTFCRRQDHYRKNSDLSMKDNDYINIQHIDFDDETEDEEEKENEKKNSYDSGYGSVMPKRQLSRDIFLKITQPLNRN